LIADLPGPAGLPVLGNVHQVRLDRLHLTVEEWCRRYGPVFRFDIGRRRIVVVGDAEEINTILRHRPDGFRRLRELQAVLCEMGITGVFSAEGDDWKRQRRLAVTGLNSHHLHRYFHVIRTTTERLHRRLKEVAHEGRPCEIGHEFASYTVDITSALAFGHDLNTLERRDNELQGHIETVFAAAGRRVGSPIPYWRYVKLPADRTLDRSLAELRRAVGAFIERARAEIEARPELLERPENFLQGMLAAQRADGTFTDDEIIGNTLTLLLAGEDTTSHTLGWTTWFLATRPDVQERWAHEANEVLGDDPFPADYETVAHLHYGEAVLRESMRLKPVAPYIFVESIADTTIAGTHIPAGTRLFLLIRSAGLNASGIDHPGDFDPERWLADDDAARDLNASLGFGGGPRFCPGRNLAFLEAKTAMAMLARNFELALDDSGGPVEERLAFTMAPAGLSVQLREADPSAVERHRALSSP
jgi:cytochrome P450